MKNLLIISIFFFISHHTISQENHTKPNENITVNKAYDEHGNLIKYDSIYSYSYSSKNTLQDSIKVAFQSHFNNHSFFNDSVFNDFFKRDSLSDKLNHDTFFFDEFINHDEMIKNMMKRMDSIQHLYFNQNSKPQTPTKPEKTKPQSKKSNYKQI